MRSEMAPNLSGVRLSFLMRGGFALNKVRGLLCLRRSGNKQPRIGLEPCNPRLEICRGVFKSLLLDSCDAAQHGGGHLCNQFLLRVGFRTKMGRVIEVLPMQALWVSSAV